MADAGAGGGGGGNGGDDGGSNGGGGSGSGNGNDEKLAQFMTVTGVTSEDIANHWLEANAFSLEGAVSMFMDGSAGGGAGGDGAGRASGGGAPSSTQNFPAMAGGPQPGDPDYVRPADPYKRQRLVDDAGSHGVHPYGGMATSSRMWGGAAAQGHNPFRDFQEESRQAALASNPFSSSKAGMSSDPAVGDKERKLANMFSPPTDIMFMGDFQAARQAAKQQKKWLLVNIQTEDEFACHRLNRDVWKDEMVQNIIECNCIFWQQPSISEEAKLYCRRYNASGFPHMALIDPRTGMKVWNFQGFLAPPEFIEKITDVTDKISLQDGAPPRLPPPPPRQPQLPPSTGGSEDQMLAAAIAASLDACGGGGGGNSSDSSNSGGGTDAEKMVGPPTSSGGGSGAPVATVAGGPISIDGSDDEEEEEEEDSADLATAVLMASKVKGKGKVRGGAGGGAAAGAGNAGTGSSNADAVDVTDDGNPEARVGAEGRGGDKAAVTRDAASMSSHGGSDGAGAKMDVEEGEEEEVVEDPPEDDCLEKISVRFQLPTGARVLRTFRKSSDVRQLFLFVRAELEGAKSKPFDVRTVRPPSSVRSKQGNSIEQAGLANSTVVVAWED